MELLVCIDFTRATTKITLSLDAQSYVFEHNIFYEIYVFDMIFRSIILWYLVQSVELN